MNSAHLERYGFDRLSCKACRNHRAHCREVHGGFFSAIETGTEIVAKKLWHRGDRFNARDLFDLSLVIEREPDALRRAAQFLLRHRQEALQQLDQRESVLRVQFEAIDVLRYRPTFDEASGRAKAFLQSLEVASGFAAARRAAQARKKAVTLHKAARNKP